MFHFTTVFHYWRPRGVTVAENISQVGKWIFRWISINQSFCLFQSYVLEISYISDPTNRPMASIWKKFRPKVPPTESHVQMLVEDITLAKVPSTGISNTNVEKWSSSFVKFVAKCSPIGPIWKNILECFMKNSRYCNVAFIRCCFALIWWQFYTRQILVYFERI